MKRILIADDKATGRELVRTILENDGYEVHEAVDGLHAHMGGAAEHEGTLLRISSGCWFFADRWVPMRRLAKATPKVVTA